MTQFLSKGELPSHIIVEQKSKPWGIKENGIREVINYPVCEFAKLFANVAGKKTLSNEVCGMIERFGIEVEVEHTPVKAWKV